ncbi:MAG: PEP-utilizing enzyme [Dokdonella sp.]|uniref:PEP-utilizing enzyme n=1 Tax=Dokdonella sp. TaxID=2291710 RepID=UPI003262F882
MNGIADRSRSDAAGSPWNGKRSTLAALAPQLRCSRVPAGIGIGFARWNDRREATLDFITAHFGQALLAARSDRADEDALAASKAGHYRTVLDVPGSDRSAIADAIDAVFGSYGHARSTDEVFMQRQVTGVRDAAVAFTHALPDGAPYHVVSVAKGPRSDHVTRGDTDVDTWYSARTDGRLDGLPAPYRVYLDALREIESVVGDQSCEVEMVADDADIIWLLQVRPLTLPPCDEAPVDRLRHALESDLAALATQPPLLGMMPDWNPAELLGEHPRPLARELFDTLITRRAWWLGRRALGYARIEETRLLRFIAGRPYVDARTSFRSLVPAGLDADIGERLVAAYCERLRAHPEYHDKIEFDVAFTTLTFGLADAFASRYPALLDTAQFSTFQETLRAPTSAALDAALTDRLIHSFTRDLRLAPPGAEPARLRRWIERLELRTGVRFAMAARQAFAIEALLRSAVDIGALDPTSWLQMRQSVASCAGLSASIDGDDAHVRAGTFEISAPTRKEFARPPFAQQPPRDANPRALWTLDAQISRDLRDALHELRLHIDVEALFAQYARVVHAREFGKCVFARGISLALDALASRAESLGIDRCTAGWLGLDDLLDPALARERLQERALVARNAHAVEARIRMPLLIRDHRLDVVHYAHGQANWLGNGRVDDVPTIVDAQTDPDRVPMHALIAIASANPGFDWIFRRRPAALLTAFGGPNSHMAIRCAEAGVPALLGIGPDAFRRVISARRISIDFGGRRWSLG